MSAPLQPRPILFPFLALALAALLFSGCAKTGSTPAPNVSSAKKILHVGNGAEPQDLDPQVTTGVTEHHLLMALFEGLVAEHPSGEGIAPGVAESWETSSDQLTWTFHLRANAKWSNGDPVTAHDFIRSYQRILTPVFAAEYSYQLYVVKGAEDFNKGALTDFAKTGFAALDDHTLVLRLVQPVPYLLYALRHTSWFPVHLPTIEKFGPTDRKGSAWTRAGNLVGNGPFILTKWLPNQAITVDRSPTYWNAAAVNLDTIVFHPVEDNNTEERMFRSGQLDVTETIPTDKIDTYRREHPELLRLDPFYGTYYYNLNLTRPPLDDVRVRRALALALDREAIVKTILRAGQEPAYHFTPPYAGYTPSDKLTGGLAEARRLLAEAGYPEGKGLRRLEILYNTSEAHKAVAEAVQQMWRTGLGVEVALRNEEWKVYLDSKDNLAYDICRAGWIGDFPDPHGFLEVFISGGGNNDTGYANPDYDRLLKSALGVPDQTARMNIYRRLDSLLTRDVPEIPLYFYKRVHLINPRVQNWVPNIIDNRGWQYIDIAPVAATEGTKHKD